MNRLFFFFFLFKYVQVVKLGFEGAKRKPSQSALLFTIEVSALAMTCSLPELIYRSNKHSSY